MPRKVWYHCGSLGPGDKFDMAHFGRGEGYAGMGRGMYFADKREVAEVYCKYAEEPYLTMVEIRGNLRPLGEEPQPGDVGSVVRFNTGPFRPFEEAVVWPHNMSAIRVLKTLPVIEGLPSPKFASVLKVPPKMLREMQSWTRSNLDRRPASRHFQFDLSGWPYLSRRSPADAERMLKKKHPRGVKLTLSDKSHRFGEARWDDEGWEITIYDTEDLDHALHFLRHEAQHMAQDMLAEIKGVPDAGLPSRRIRTPEWDEVDLSKPRFTGPADPHALMDREYQTRLTDSIENYLRFGKGLSPKAWITRDTFFVMLRAKAPGKYRDAVGKFVAEVGRRGASARRVASRYRARRVCWATTPWESR